MEQYKKITIGEVYNIFKKYGDLNLKVNTPYGYKKIEACDITAKNSKVIHTILENEMEIKTSPKHKFKTSNGRFKEIELLNPGQKLKTIKGDSKIKSIILLSETKDLYDIQVQDVKQYYSNGIVSHNSSILKLIQFCLHGTVPQNTTSYKKIINKYNRSKNGIVELILIKNNERYQITRTIIPKKTDNVSFELEFYKIDKEGEIIENLNGEKRQETEKNIEKQFGTQDMFEILSLFSAQKKQVDFIDCKNADRLKHVNQFLGLQEFTLKHKAVLEDLSVKNKVHESLIKSFNNTVDEEELLKEIENLNSFIINNQFNIENHEEKLKYIDESIFEQQQKLSKYEAIVNQPYEEVDVIEFKISKQEKRIKELETIKNGKDEEVEKLKKRVYDLETSKIELQNKILDTEEIKKKELEKIADSKLAFEENFHETYENFSKLEKSLKEKIHTLEKDIAVLQSESQRHRKQLSINVCNGCGKDYTEKDKKKNTDRILEIEKEVENKQEKINKLGKECEKVQIHYNSIKDLYLDLQDTENLIQTNEKNKTNLEKQILTIENEISKIDSKYLVYDVETGACKNTINILKEKILESRQKEQEIKDAKELMLDHQKLILEFKSEKKILQDNIYSLKSISATNKEKIKNLQNEIVKYNNKLKEIQESEKEIRIYNIYKKIVAKDGFPLFIVDEKISAINQEINIISNQVFDFDITFKIDNEKGELNLEFQYDNDKDEETCDVSLASGSETFVINLCIKVGLTQLSEQPKLQTLIIDEGFDVLDPYNLDKIPVLFTSLLNYYKNLILISHVDELKDIYNTQILLSKENSI